MVQETCGMSLRVIQSFKLWGSADASMQKEEKAHDEKIANANAKIKQAGTSASYAIIARVPTQASGQLYEKKVKRNAFDAPEEHNRYINLLSTIGPEISQTK